MSVRPSVCESCQCECRFERLAPFAGDTTYAVAWVCPQCGKRALDACPLGPLNAAEGTCLNCGDLNTQDDTPCPGCGLSKSDARAFLAVDDTTRDVDTVVQFFDRGLFRRGLAILNLVLQGNPGSEEGWRIKSSLLHALGYFQAEASMLAAAIEAGAPRSLLFRLGFVQQEIGNHEQAVRAYEDFLLENPVAEDRDLVLANLGNSLAALGRAEDAEERFRQAIDMSPFRATHYLNHATMLMDRSRWQEARTILDRSIEAQAGPESLRCRALLDKAVCLAELGDGQASLECADRALDMGHDPTRSHYLRGRALALQGRLEEARAAMDVVLASDPGHAEALRALEKLDLASSRPWWKFWGK